MISYFDCHLHLGSADDRGFDAFLNMLEKQSACVGGNLILNTYQELDVFVRRSTEIPKWVQVVPCLDLLESFPDMWDCGWIKLHPQIQQLKRTDVPLVLNKVLALRPRLKGVMVHCFPWGPTLDFGCSLELVGALAQSLPDSWVLATHGGGYDSWAYRAHVGGLRNVLFDFSASLSYYAGSDLLRPLQRYLIHSPERVLFGTDWPSATYQEQWAEMLAWSKRADIDDDRLGTLLLENSRRTWPSWKARH